MKNQKNKFGEKIQKTFKGVCIASLSLLLNNSMHSQNKTTNFGISASSSVSGQGFGTMYTPSVFYKVNDCKVELGLNIQKRKLNVSGMQVNVEYILLDEAKKCLCGASAGRLELFAFSTIKYSWDAYLSKLQIKTEKMVAGDSNIPFDNLKFAAIETYVGFGLNVRLTKKLKYQNSIGFGGWTSINGERNLYRQYDGLSIALSTGLTLDF